MTDRILISFMVALVFAFGCSGRVVQGHSSGSVHDESYGEKLLIGNVNLVGTSTHNWVQLITDDGKKYSLVPAESFEYLIGEIRSLSGQKLEVRGHEEDGKGIAGTVFRVVDYELLPELPGKKTYEGRIICKSGKVYFEARGGKSYAIAKLWDGLCADYDGALAWVLGEIVEPDGKLYVSKYYWLKEGAKENDAEKSH